MPCSRAVREGHLIVGAGLVWRIAMLLCVLDLDARVDVFGEADCRASYALACPTGARNGPSHTPTRGRSRVHHKCRAIAERIDVGLVATHAAGRIAILGM